ncbi:hypothetical protein pb186bvf_011263 [Paramecium bursaria]
MIVLILQRSSFRRRLSSWRRLSSRHFIQQLILI